MKRFYEKAGAVCVDDGAGWGVALDGRRLKTPAKNDLVVPTQSLAEAIAGEWDAQDEKIVPESMAMMTLTASAIDRIEPQIDAIVTDLANYAGTDTLCYRATDPSALVEKQSADWDPILKKAEAAFDLRFVLAGGIIHQTQPEETLNLAKALLSDASSLELSSIHKLISITGSFVLGLFVWKGQLDATTAFDLGLLEELYQAEVWGSDYEAEDRRVRLKNDMLSAERFLTLLR